MVPTLQEISGADTGILEGGDSGSSKGRVHRDFQTDKQKKIGVHEFLKVGGSRSLKRKVPGNF